MDSRVKFAFVCSLEMSNVRQIHPQARYMGTCQLHLQRRCYVLIGNNSKEKENITLVMLASRLPVQMNN